VVALCECQLTQAAQPASGCALHLRFACARLSQAICFVQTVQLMPSHHRQISFVVAAAGRTSTIVATMPQLHAAEQSPVQQLHTPNTYRLSTTHIQTSCGSATSCTPTCYQYGLKLVCTQTVTLLVHSPFIHWGLYLHVHIA
jgi:hypothetical protein